MSLHTYRIRRIKDVYELLQDGDWLGTYTTEEAAQAEMEHRKAFDKIREEHFKS